MGRPKKDVVRDKQYRLRLTEEEKNQLLYLSEWYGLPISEVVRMCCEDKFKRVKSAFGQNFN